MGGDESFDPRNFRDSSINNPDSNRDQQAQ